MAAEPLPAPEPVWYYASPRWYGGTAPPWYDASQLPGTKILEENWRTIRDEVVSHYEGGGDGFQPNFTPYAYREVGWKTVNLCSYFLRNRKARKLLPRTAEILDRVPGLSLAQVSVLEPHVRIKAHIGDCSAVVRSHLGLVVPGRLPELGMIVGRERRCWEEGKVFAFSIAHRHYAWNDTDDYRIALVFDVFRPEYQERRYAIAGKALAVIAMKWFATRVPPTKKLPRLLVRALHEILGRVFQFRIWIQRSLGL